MFLRFERVQRPNSYNDNPITSLSWMKHDPNDQSSNVAPNPSLVSDTPLAPTLAQHQHHFHEPIADLNNNSEFNEQGFQGDDNQSVGSLFTDISTSRKEEKEGWLAVGNYRGIVGVSFTTIDALSLDTLDPKESEEKQHATESSVDSINDQCPRSTDTNNSNQVKSTIPLRTNYNLRGHRSEIIFVRWNEPYQKLASCDRNGVIFVWIKYEGRWSIELINDRNTRVADFAWSHDGRMALICYMDGFVLVGSVSGQRYWSSMLNLNDCTITCGTWTPNDQQVLFGTSNGHILVISVHGTFVTQISVQECVEINGMLWSCKRFASKSASTSQASNSTDYNGLPNEQGPLLAVSFVDGSIYLMRNYDDVFPFVISTGLLNVKIEWSSNGQLLAVGGHRMVKSDTSATGYVYANVLNFYSIYGTLVKTVTLDFDQQPLSAIAWGNSDKRIFVACGQLLLVGWVVEGIPSLNLLSRLKIYTCLKEKAQVNGLPVPEPIKQSVRELFSRTIHCYLPECSTLRQFVLRPPANHHRLYCTLMRNEEHHSNPGAESTYILYLEYLGGLVPILKGKRSSKLKPEFVIFDPEMSGEVSSAQNVSVCSKSFPTVSAAQRDSKYMLHSSRHNSSESENEDSIVFPYLTPKTRRRLRCRSAQLSRHFSRQNAESSPGGSRLNSSQNVSFCDEMPDSNKIVLITSNIWGTKFKFLGLSPLLPSYLGSVTYRTSLLHLQPRQMALIIKELNSTNTLNHNHPTEMCSKSINNSYGSGVSSDSEDEYSDQYRLLGESVSNTPAIAPMTPFKSVRNSMLVSSAVNISSQVAQSSELQTGQLESSPADEPPTVESRISKECNSIVSCLSNMTEEFLTLQINQSDNGKSTYNLEISSASNRMSNKTKEPEVYEDPEEALSPDGNIPSSTMVRQFKHQNFQSESPKHVSHFRQSHISKSSSAQGYSPNISPNKNLRNKILKESPRKSSVSYCSSEFSTKSYIETSPICDIESVIAGKSSSFKVQRFKTCSSEAYAAMNSNPLLFNGSMPFSSEPSIETGALFLASSANTNANRVASSEAVKVDSFAGSNKSQVAELTSRHKTVKSSVNESPNLKSKSFKAKSAMCDSQSQQNEQPNKRFHMQTYHIYDDTLSVQRSPAKEDNSAVHDKRMLFRNGSSQSKSLDDSSINAMPVDIVSVASEKKDLNLSHERQPFLTDVEQIVKLLSNKLSSKLSNKDKSTDEQCMKEVMSTSKQSAPKSINPQNNQCVSSRSSSCLQSPSLSLFRRSSLPFAGVTSRKSQQKNIKSETPAPISKSGALSLVSLADQSISSMAVATSLANLPTPVNRSLPVSPSQNANDRKNKQWSRGRNFFYSPNVIRKMRRKLSYLDCSSEDDNSSDEDDELAYRDNRSSSGKSGGKQLPAHRPKSGNKEGNQYRRAGSKQHCHDKQGKEFVLHNKAPLWNEVSQVYQLDFGGRVTQESAKNFQIEYQGRQVMQFGRIDTNAYTLDFEYPFSAVQALAVALANVTQRLK